MVSPPDLAVELRGGYYFGQLERLIHDLQPLFNLPDGSRRIELDLRHLVFIGPTAMALLLAAANRAGEDAEVHIHAPQNPLTAKYFWRSDFVKLFVNADLPEGFERKHPKGFRPCVHFTTDDECAAVAGDMTAALLERVPKSDNIARAGIITALSELTENVFYHADTSLGGYAAAAYSKKKRIIEIGIVDLGIGVRASLSKNPELPRLDDDVEAVRQAMRPTISSTPDRNSGFGLAFTQGLLLANGGSMRVRSGHGVANIGPDVEYGRRNDYMPGTLVLLRARADKPLDAKEAWDDLMKEIRRVLRSHIHGS